MRRLVVALAWLVGLSCGGEPGRSADTLTDAPPAQACSKDADCPLGSSCAACGGGAARCLDGCTDDSRCAAGLACIQWRVGADCVDACCLRASCAAPGATVP